MYLAKCDLGIYFGDLAVLSQLPLLGCVAYLLERFAWAKSV